MVVDDLHRGTDHPQHPAFGIVLGQILLLDAAQSLGRRGIAGDQHQGTALPEQVVHPFGGELEHRLKGAVAVRGAGVVAQVDVVSPPKPESKMPMGIDITYLYIFDMMND